MEGRECMKPLKITTGAMVTAIFGVMLLLNRQTGGLFQEVLLFLYPIPMVAYAAQYDWKSSIPAFAAMTLLSVLLGNFTGIFYGMSQALIGLVFGGCLHHKVDMTKILFVVMLLSAAVNVLDIAVLGTLTGFDLNLEIEEMQRMLNSMFQQSGMVVPETMLATGYLKQIFVVSMIVLGGIQGFLVYEVSLMILHRLRFPVQKPKSIFLYAPPKWTGYGALVAVILYTTGMTRPFQQDMLQNAVLTIGTFGYIYLVCFGFIAILLTFKIYFPRMRLLRVILCVILLFLFPLLEMAAGFMYIVSQYHMYLMEQYSATS